MKIGQVWKCIQDEFWFSHYANTFQHYFFLVHEKDYTVNLKIHNPNHFFVFLFCSDSSFLVNFWLSIPKLNGPFQISCPFEYFLLSSIMLWLSLVLFWTFYHNQIYPQHTVILSTHPALKFESFNFLKLSTSDVGLCCLIIMKSLKTLLNSKN